MSALPLSRRRESPPARTFLPGHGSYGLMRRSRSTLPSFGLSLVRGVSAGCYQPLLPAGPSRRYLCESFLGCLDPCHGGTWSAFACFFLYVIGLPPFPIEVGFPASARQNDFLTDPFFETAVISLGSGPQVCSPPRSFPPQRLIASGRPGLLSEQNMLRFLRMHRNCLPSEYRQLMVWGLAPHKIHNLVGCSSEMGMLRQLTKRLRGLTKEVVPVTENPFRSLSELEQDGRYSSLAGISIALAQGLPAHQVPSPTAPRWQYCSRYPSSR